MNYQNNGNGIIITNDYVIIDGEKHLIPAFVKKKNSNSQSINGKKIKINGYKFKNGVWKK